MLRLDRRRFLARSVASLAALAVPEWARAQAFAAPRDETLEVPVMRRRETASFTIVAGGDTVLGHNLQVHFDALLETGLARDELYALYFAGVQPLLHAADIAIVNLECPFTERGVRLPKHFNFRARHEMVEVLQWGGVNLVTLANNHIRDFGDEGVLDTLATLDRAGIARFGAGRSMDEARQPCIIERNGLRVGFIGHYFQAAPDMIEPREIYANDVRAGAAGCYQDRDAIRAMVQEDAESVVSQSDVAIAYFHWGKEGSYRVRDYQIELAHMCVDAGCKAVLGAHPHRLQGVELYKGAPIFYSLGNFVFGGIKNPKDRLSALARLVLSPEGKVEAELIPIMYTAWPDAPFQPVVLAGVEREQALRRIAMLSRSFPRSLPVLAHYLDAPERPAG
jgi:poly-gamma-glutamate synthesis protein (capsule biosynthesis protein)